MFDVSCLVLGVRCCSSVVGVWCFGVLMFGVWRLAFKVWCFGARCLVFVVCW